MRLRRLALVLLLYTAMDFANPLMAGAVTFTDGTITVVQADRSAAVEIAPVGVADDQRRSVEPQTWRLPAPVEGGHRAHRRSPVCRSALPRPEPPSNPTSEDHLARARRVR